MPRTPWRRTSSAIRNASSRVVLELATRAKAAGDLVADLDLDVRLAALERLLVGVDRDELHLQCLRDHPVDRVPAPAAAADDLDPRASFVQLALFHDDQVILLCISVSHGELKLVLRVLSRKNLAATSLFFGTCCRT